MLDGNRSGCASENVIANIFSYVQIIQLSCTKGEQKMLMVVLGAGASYDCVSAYPPPEHRFPDRLPLADELFQSRDNFTRVMQLIPKCLPIIPYVQTLSAGKSVEQVLEHLQSEAKDYPERYRQLAAIRYYLHAMLWECELRCLATARGVTNYKTLLDQIERWRKPNEQVCLVTFNYDRLIEDALPAVGVDIREIPDYIADDRYRLLKLHGSVNWGRDIDTPIRRIDQLDGWSLVHEIINNVPDLTISRKYRIVKDLTPPSNPISKFRGVPIFPAIAIPVETKQHYECPDDHVAALREFIPKTTKLLMIGWRATEKHFLSLLSEGIHDELRVMSVAGNLDAAQQSVKNLRDAGVRAYAIESEGGFSDFIVNREGDEFLRS